MKLAVLLPLHRPGPEWDSHIADAVRGLRERFPEEKYDLHFFLTNDGAPLELYPPECLEKLVAVSCGKFHFLPYEINRGKGYSLRHLCALSDAEYTVYTDGDFPFGWEPVARAFDLLLAGSDVVMGRRTPEYAKALTPMRRILSGGVKVLNRLLLGLPRAYQETQSGLKGFDARGRELFLLTQVKTFLFDTEFILLACRENLKIDVLDIGIRPGIHLSSMGMKVMFRELGCLAGILWRIRFRRKCRSEATR